MAYLLAVNPHHTPKIDKDEKSEKQLKKGNSKKKKPEKEEVSLTDFTRSHVSKNEVTFQKIMSADKNRHSRKHWWVSDLNKNNVFARPQSRTMRMLDKQGKEQVALVGCKNRLMFYPEAAPASKTITESKDPFVNKTIATENTRFCAQAFAVKRADVFINGKIYK